MEHALLGRLVDAGDGGPELLVGLVGVGGQGRLGAGVDLRAGHLVAQTALLVLAVALHLGLDVGHGLHLR